MKKLLYKALGLFVFVLFCMTFGSCKKDYVVVEESAIVRDDNPPKEMFSSDNDYGSFNRVFIEQEDMDKAIYYGNIQIEANSYWDSNTGRQVVTIYSQDYYKIPAKKYWGPYHEKILVSKSVEYYLIPASTMSTFKDFIKRKGSVISYLSGVRPSFDSQWKMIDGAE